MVRTRSAREGATRAREGAIASPPTRRRGGAASAAPTRASARTDAGKARKHSSAPGKGHGGAARVKARARASTRGVMAAIVCVVLFVVGVAMRARVAPQRESASTASSGARETLERALASVVRDDFVAASRFFMDDLVSTRASSKAPAMLLVSRDGEALASARERLDEATRGWRCALTFDCGSSALGAMATDEARGTIQRELSLFFRRCSTRGAVVVLHDVGRLAPAALPALLPALSEDGAYTYDGESIRTTDGVFLLTAELPGASGDDERTFTRNAKAALGEALRSDDAADATALAFRRRIDVAAPMA